MSGIATGTALMIAGGIGAAGSLGGAALQSNAAGKAASAEEQAAEYAANMQGQLGQESLENEVNTQEQNQADQEPWLQGGAEGMSSLEYLLGLQNSATGAGGGTGGQSLSIPGVSGTVNLPAVKGISASPNTTLGAFGSLMQGYPGGQFTAPTAAQAAASPGEQFALNQGENAVQAGASANGSLLTGGTLNAEQQFGQGLASTNYNNVYNQALQSYNTNYNTWSNNQANQFNRLAAIAGMGQTSAQTLGTQGVQSAGQIANTLGNTGTQLGQDYMNAGNATASGYINSANAWSGGMSGAAGGLSQMMMLQQLMGMNGTGQTAPPVMNVGGPGQLQNANLPLAPPGGYGNYGDNQFGLNNPWAV